jgi:integrase
VARQLAALVAAVATGEAIAAEAQTVGEFLSQWLQVVIKPHRRASTYRAYESIVRLHLMPTVGHQPLARLTPQYVQAALQQRATGALAGKPCAVQRMRDTLRSALKYALRCGVVVRNAAALAEPPRYARPEVRPFTPEEARAFLAAIRGERLEALYAVALALGLRQGEALGLTWDDVDLAARTIHVRQQLQRVDGQLRRCDLKTPQSRRTLLLPPILLAVLVAHRERQRAERHLAGAQWREPIATLVFTTTIGTPLQSRTVVKQFHALVARAGLRRQRFHDLRHCCATLLLAQGVSLRVIMETLGHNQIAVTMNTYAHVIPALAQDATARMETFLQSAP